MATKSKIVWLGVCVAGMILLSTTGYTMEKGGNIFLIDDPISSTAHAPIDISGNAELIAYCAGNGTDGSSGNPFILEDFEIDASAGVGLFLQDTDLHLIIRNCRVEDNAGGGSPYGISLVNCSNVNVTGNVCIGNAVGISIAYKCNNITVTNNYCSIAEGYFVDNSMGIAILSNGVGFETSNITVSKNNCTNMFYGIIIGCENSTISDNNCTSNHYGISSFMLGNDNNTIIGNDCSYSSTYGIRLANSDSNNTVSNNNCSFAGTYGIYTNNATNTMFVDNDCSNTDRVGIYQYKSLNNTVAWNDCSFGREGGINLDYSNQTFILSNDCRYPNELDREPAIALWSSDNNTVAFNNCSNSEVGISMWRSENTTLISNELESIVDAGIQGYDSSGIRAFDHLMVNCGMNIVGETSNNVIDTSNKVNGKSVLYYENERDLEFSGETNVGQIILVNCTTSVIENLEMSAMNVRSVILVKSDHIVVAANNFSANVIGIVLENSTDNTITGNNLSSNTENGILMINAESNAFFNNDIAYNGEYGVVLEYSSDNHFWMNQFVENVEAQAYFDDDESLGNLWDNGTVGNYWSDYQIQNPTAEKENGMWSIPYNISDDDGISDMDHYPSISPDFYAPTWIETPTDQRIEVGEPFSYDASAIDNVAIDTYWLNDSTSFEIDDDGVITNATILALGSYNLRIFANDTAGRMIFASLVITVEDTEPPIWLTTPLNVTVVLGQIFNFNLEAFDNVAIASYWINDTSVFLISTNGTITVNSSLITGIYPLEIIVTDTSGNELRIVIIVTVNDAPTTTTTTTSSSTTTPTTSPSDPGDGEFEIPSYPLPILIPLVLMGIFGVRKKVKNKSR